MPAQESKTSPLLLRTVGTTFPTQPWQVNDRVYLSSALVGSDGGYYRLTAEWALRRLQLDIVTLKQHWPQPPKGQRGRTILDTVLKRMKSCRAVVFVDGPRLAARLHDDLTFAEHELKAANALGLLIYRFAVPGIPAGNKRGGYEAHFDGFYPVSTPEDLDKVITSLFSSLLLDQPSRQVILTPQVTPDLIKHLLQNPKALQEIPDRLFEELVADLLRADGWDIDLIVRPNAPGPDIIACSTMLLEGFQLRMIVECKRYLADHPVGVEAVRNLVYWVNEEHRATLGMLATTSRFTSDATRLVEQHHFWRISLRDHNRMIDWLAQFQGRPQS